MSGMNTLQMIKMIPTFDGRNYVEWTRSFYGILQITWSFLSKIVSGLERPEPISRENIGGGGNASDIDDNKSNASEVSAVGSRNLDEEPIAIVTRLRPGTQQRSIFQCFTANNHRWCSSKRTVEI